MVDSEDVKTVVRKAILSGEPCDLEPMAGAQGARVPVPAELIHDLCLKEAGEIDRRVGFDLRGAHVTGAVSLRRALLRFPLRFERCSFERGLDLEAARCRGVELRECQVPVVRLDGARTYGSVQVVDCTLQRIGLRGASIRGDLHVTDGEIEGQDVDELGDAERLEAVSGDGVTVFGEVSLRFLHTRATVNLRRSVIRGRLSAIGAKLKAGRAPALRLEEARIDRNLDLKFGFLADGGVRMDRLRLEGNLDCRGGCFQVAEEQADEHDALDCHDAQFGGDVLFKRGLDGKAKLHPFKACGQVNLFRATIGGSLECHGAQFESRGRKGEELKHALDGEELTVEGSVLLKTYLLEDDSNYRRANDKTPRVKVRCETTGAVSFRRARVRRRLSCSGALLNKDRRGPLALLLDDAKVERNIDLRWDPRNDFYFEAYGTVDMDRVEVGGSVDCGGARIRTDAPGRVAGSSGALRLPALLLRDAQITGGVYLCAPKRRPAESSGEGAGTSSPKVPGDHSFQAVGEVSLARTEIGGELGCNDASLSCHEPASAVCLCLDDTHVGGHLRLNGTRLLRVAGQEGVAGQENTTNPGPQRVRLEARALDVGGIAWLGIDVETSDSLCLCLQGARFRQILEHPRSAWPEPGYLRIEGTRYEQLELPLESTEGRAEEPGGQRPRPMPGGFDGGGTAAQREQKETVWVEWLNLQFPEERQRQRPAREVQFAPQPHEHLATVLRSMGMSDEARRVTQDKRERQLRNLPRPARALAWAFLKPIAYGQKPWNALWVGVGLWLLGFFIFWWAMDAGAMKPALVGVLLEQHRELHHRDDATTVPHEQPVESYPAFSPLVYSADTFLPIIDLHQEKYWLPRCIGPCESELIWGWNDWVANRFRIYLWIHIALGWLVTTLAIAGLTGLVDPG